MLLSYELLATWNLRCLNSGSPSTLPHFLSVFMTWTFAREWNRAFVGLASFVSHLSGMSGLYWLMSSGFENFWFLYFVYCVFCCCCYCCYTGENKSCPCWSSLSRSKRASVCLIFCGTKREVHKQHFCCILKYDGFLKKKHCPLELRAEQSPSFHETQFLLERLTDRQTMFF